MNLRLSFASPREKGGGWTTRCIINPIAASTMMQLTLTWTMEHARVFALTCERIKERANSATGSVRSCELRKASCRAGEVPSRQDDPDRHRRKSSEQSAGTVRISRDEQLVFPSQRPEFSAAPRGKYARTSRCKRRTVHSVRLTIKAISRGSRITRDSRRQFRSREIVHGNHRCTTLCGVQRRPDHSIAIIRINSAPKTSRGARCSPTTYSRRS